MEAHMQALGFGAKVTGGGSNPTIFPVKSGKTDGPDTLTDALKKVKALNGQPAKIVIKKGVTVQRTRKHTIEVQNLTIAGEPNSLLDNNQFYFDCQTSDNILLQNLTFRGTPAVNEKPKDTIDFDANKGRGPIGFWIDHCSFGPYFDLNITANAADLADKNADPLLITVSSCLFENDNPDGKDRENNGALGISGPTGVDPKKGSPPPNTRINAYATVCRNLFRTVRRRSPRSSGLCHVHAFNNVLLKWGVKGASSDQSNGMVSGHNGRFVADANYFLAGPLDEAIQVSATPDVEGHLTVHEKDDTLRNVYENGATKAKTVGTEIDINADYRARKVAVPPVMKMDEKRRNEIEAEAGATLKSV
jgi:pectate lyase